MLLDLKKRRWGLFGIVLLLLFRLVTQIALYRAGFNSLTADDFGRIIVAAKWSEHPTMVWYGVWLPLHTYIFGTAFLIKWEILWLPRVATILTGLISICLMYLLASSLFESKLVGLVSAFLLSVNPAHVWLSGTPLTEMPNAMFLLTTIWAFGVYLKNPKPGYLYTAACALALANGFRFESWFVSIIFTLILLSKGFLGFIKRKYKTNEILSLVIAACIPWIFPLGWVIGNYVMTKNPFYFQDAITNYKLHWYGNHISFSNYVETFLKIDPYLTVFGVIGIITCLLLNRRSKAILWYVATTIIPLVVFILLHGGQLEPRGNYIRYLALYSFLFYPSLGYGLVLCSRAIKSKKLKWGVFLILGFIAITQLRTAFRFTNDPAGDGLAVGEAIRELRAQNPGISNRPVMIELSYWQYLAILVGANDIEHIMYDRVKDDNLRQAKSLLLTDEKLFLTCLKSYHISHIVVKDSQIRTMIEDKLQLRSVREENGYAFYPISKNYLDSLPASGTITCPLSFAANP